MKESIQAAMTVVRARAEKLGINSEFHENVIFIFMCQMVPHQKMVRAGIAMCTALVSLLNR